MPEKECIYCKCPIERRVEEQRLKNLKKMRERYWAKKGYDTPPADARSGPRGPRFTPEEQRQKNLDGCKARYYAKKAIKQSQSQTV